MLVEIPSGSMACGPNNSMKRTHFVTISSYSTQKIKFWCYFPSGPSGKLVDFYSFPIIVAQHRTNRIVSWTAAQKLMVKSGGAGQQEQEQRVAAQSVSLWDEWRRLSVSGNYDEIYRFLSS